MKSTGTLENLVDKVDVTLSRNQSYSIHKSEDDSGRQYLCNRTHGVSWWLPAGKQFDEEVYLTDGQNIPYLFDRSNNKSVYCIDMQKQCMRASGVAPSTPSSSQIALPPPKPADSTGAVAPAHPGVVPLPGAQMSTEGSTLAATTCEQPGVCKGISYRMFF